MPPAFSVPLMLRRCGPLMDAVQFALSFITWTTALGLPFLFFSFYETSKDAQDNGLIYFGLLLIVLDLMVFGAYWLLMAEGKKDLCIFLRAFRTDASSDQLRAWLKAAMGQHFRFGGIRPPAERVSFWVTLMSPLFTGLRYLGTRQFEMVAPDHNWMARLLATFAETRVVFIDIRDITPHVLDEIALAWQVFGANRIIFIVDDTRSEADWRKRIRQQIATEDADVHMLVWRADPAIFVPQVKAMLERVPEGVAVVTREALRFVHEKVGADQWDVRPMDQAWVIVLVQQATLAVLGGVLWFIHPLVLQIAGGLFALEGLSLYRQAWCRARKQRLHAKEINPAGPPSAGRLWGSLALMLGVLSSPFLIMLAASISMLVSAPGHAARAQIIKAESEIQRLRIALLTYEALSGMNPPTTEQGLEALVEKPVQEPIPRVWKALLESKPLDPWSRPYRYESPARRSQRDGYDLWSC
jgi:type II secretion system protein G